MYRFLFPALALCLSAVALDGHAQKTGRSKDKSGNNANTRPMSVTPEREAAAMTFVQQHHPELAELLVYLKRNLPKDYDKAARDLFRTSERLARLKDNGDEKRYEHELKLWQIRSRIQLLTARLRTRPDEKLESELRSLLEQQYDLRLSQLQRERDRVAARLEKVNQQIDQLQEARQQAIDKQIRSLAERRDNPTKTKPTRVNRSSEPTSPVSKKGSD